MKRHFKGTGGVPKVGSLVKVAAAGSVNNIRVVLAISLDSITTVGYGNYYGGKFTPTDPSKTRISTVYNWPGPFYPNCTWGSIQSFCAAKRIIEVEEYTAVDNTMNIRRILERHGCS